MRLVLLVFLVACASARGGEPDAAGGGDDAGPSIDAAVPPACTPGAWVRETIDRWPIVPSNPLLPELRLGDGGVVEVAYPRRFVGGTRRFATRGPGGAWSIDTRWDAGRGWVARAVDAGGVDHVCYQVGEYATDTDLVCSERAASGATSTATLDVVTSEALSLTTLATAADGAAHLVYTTQGHVRHAIKRPGGAWTVDDIDLAWAVNFAPLAIDDAGCAHAVVTENPYDGVAELDHAVRCGDGAWTFERIVEGPRWPYPARRGLVLGAGGRAAFLYGDGTADFSDLRLARRSATGVWSVEVLETDRVWITSPSIAATPAGGLVLAYQVVDPDPASSSVVLLEISPGGAHTRTVLGTARFPGTTAVAVDAAGDVHVVIDRIEEGDARMEDRVEVLDYLYRCPGSQSL